MGTKNCPGDFDCYANAEPDEPMFVLLARDESAPNLVREWVYRRNIRKGLTTTEARDDKAREAMACADAMEAWRESRLSPFWIVVDGERGDDGNGGLNDADFISNAPGDARRATGNG